jgi:hypothetical protein
MKTYIADAIRGNMVTGISFDARDAEHANIISRAHGWDLVGELVGLEDCEEEVMALIEASRKTLH